MFSLLYGFWKYLFQKDEYRILILGLNNAGKSTFLEQTKISFNPNYKGNLTNIKCTVGLNIGKIISNGVILNFWDLGGQRDLICLWDKYYAESHAVIYVVDSSDFEQMEDSKNAFDKIIQNEALKGTPIIFVANKQDISNCLSLSRILDIFNLEERMALNDREFNFMGASALKNTGVKETIDWVTLTVKKNCHIKPPVNADAND